MPARPWPGRNLNYAALEAFAEHRRCVALSRPAADLLRTIRQGLAQGATWKEIDARYDGALDPAIAGQVLKNVGDVRLACCVFFWAGKKMQCNHTLWSYQCLLESLQRSRGQALVSKIYRQVITSRVADHDEYGFCLALAGMCDAGLCSRAFKTLKNRVALGVAVSVNMFNVVMEGACKLSRLGQAADIMLYMASVLPPDRASYNILIKAFCGSLRIDKVETYFRQMVDRKVEPDATTYEALVAFYCRAFMPEEASRFLREMIDRGMRPSDETYLALMRCHLKNWDGVSGYKLFKEMELAGCELTGCLYQEMVDGFLDSRMFWEARLLLKEMAAKGFKPCDRVYSTLVLAFAIPSRIGEAFSVFDELHLQAGSVLSRDAYVTFVNRLSKMDRVSEALKVYEKMTDRNHWPDRDTFQELVACLCRTDNVDLARWLLNQVVTEFKNIVPSVETFNSLLAQYCCFGPSSFLRSLAIGKALELLEEMVVKLRRWPSVETFHIAVHGLCKAERALDAYKLFLTIRDFDFVPDAATCKTVIIGLCSVDSIVEAEHVFDHLISDRREAKESREVMFQVYTVILNARSRALSSKARASLSRKPVPSPGRSLHDTTIEVPEYSLPELQELESDQNVNLHLSGTKYTYEGW